MALNSPLNAHLLFKGVDVLGVVSKQLAVTLQAADELVAGGGAELAGVDLAGELEEGSKWGRGGSFWHV